MSRLPDLSHYDSPDYRQENHYIRYADPHQTLRSGHSRLGNERRDLIDRLVLLRGPNEEFLLQFVDFVDVSRDSGADRTIRIDLVRGFIFIYDLVLVDCVVRELGSFQTLVGLDFHKGRN